jgi:CBS domain-containing protein
MAKVRSLTPREIVLDIGDPREYVRPIAPEEVPLRDYLLDKKILDTDDREVEVVYDVRLAFTGGHIYVVDVDISRYGLLVRLGLKGLAAFLYRRAGAARKRLIPGSYVQSLPPQLGTLQGNLKLNILKEKLSEIHPVDLADIMEELDSSQRALLLGGLDTEHASDTLEEIDPAVQRDIVFSLSKERVAQLIAKLLGVIDIKEVFVAQDTERLKELVVENVISLDQDATMKQAADMFLRYGFRALPITDENGIVLGVVPYRDVMNLKHRILE